MAIKPHPRPEVYDDPAVIEFLANVTALGLPFVAASEWQKSGSWQMAVPGGWKHLQERLGDAEFCREHNAEVLATKPLLLGALTGPLTVVDVDRHDSVPGVEAELEARCIPVLARVDGTQGAHLYVPGHPDVRPGTKMVCVDPMWRDADVRGTGGLIWLPPSGRVKHGITDRAAYTVVRDDLLDLIDNPDDYFAERDAVLAVWQEVWKTEGKGGHIAVDLAKLAEAAKVALANLDPVPANAEVGSHRSWPTVAGFITEDLTALSAAPSGGFNDALNRTAFGLGHWVVGGVITAEWATSALTKITKARPGHTATSDLPTIISGLSAGQAPDKDGNSRARTLDDVKAKREVGTTFFEDDTIVDAEVIEDDGITVDPATGEVIEDAAAQDADLVDDFPAEAVTGDVAVEKVPVEAVVTKPPTALEKARTEAAELLAVLADGRRVGHEVEIPGTGVAGFHHAPGLPDHGTYLVRWVEDRKATTAATKLAKAAVTAAERGFEAAKKPKARAKALAALTEATTASMAVEPVYTPVRTKLGDFVLYSPRSTVEVKGGKVERTYDLVLIDRFGRRFEVDGATPSDLVSTPKLRELFAAGAAAFPTGTIDRTVLAELVMTTGALARPERVVTRHLGWSTTETAFGKTTIFRTPMGAVGPDGLLPDEACELPDGEDPTSGTGARAASIGFDRIAALDECGQVVTRFFKIFERQPVVGWALMAQMLAGLLGMDERPVIGIAAKTGSGKSHTASLIRCFWDASPRSANGWLVSCISTSPAAARAWLVWHLYLILIHDDHKTDGIRSENDNSTEVSTQGIHAGFSGAIPGRATQSGGVRAVGTIRTPVIITGERLPGSTGKMNRTLQVMLEPGGIELEDVVRKDGQVCQNRTDRWTELHHDTGDDRAFLAAVIRFLAQQIRDRDEWCPGTGDPVRSLSAEGTRRALVHHHRLGGKSRSSRLVGGLLVGWELLVAVAELGGWAAQLPTIETVTAAFVALGDSTQAAAADVSPEQQIVDAIRSALETGAVHLTAHDDSAPTEDARYASGWRVKGDGEWARMEAQGKTVGKWSPSYSHVIVLPGGLTVHDVAGRVAELSAGERSEAMFRIADPAATTKDARGPRVRSIVHPGQPRAWALDPTLLGLEDAARKGRAAWAADEVTRAKAAVALAKTPADREAAEKAVAKAEAVRKEAREAAYGVEAGDTGATTDGGGF